MKRPGYWTLLIGLYGLYFIVYEGEIMGAMLALAILALAFLLHREKRPRNAGGGWSRKPAEGKTPTRRSKVKYIPPPEKEKLAMSIDEAFAKLPAQMMSRSGSLFYSGRAAFHGTSDLYILGLNPGGSPVTQADETIARDVADWRDLPEHWSAYLDESWQGKQPGTHGMQPRMRHMFDQLGRDLRAVPASNVVFVRSATEAALAAEKASLLAQCWPVHDAVIRQLRVRTILCLGATSGRWTREVIGADRLIDRFQEENARGWTSEAHVAPDGRAVVTVTHPGRADWRNAAADPTPLVRAVLDR